MVRDYLNAFRKLRYAYPRDSSLTGHLMVALWRRLVDFVEYPSLGLNQLSLIRLVNSLQRWLSQSMYPTANHSYQVTIQWHRCAKPIWFLLRWCCFHFRNIQHWAHAGWKSISQHHRCRCSRFLVYSAVNITSSSINHTHLHTIFADASNPKAPNL